MSPREVREENNLGFRPRTDTGCFPNRSSRTPQKIAFQQPIETPRRSAESTADAVNSSGGRSSVSSSENDTFALPYAELSKYYPTSLSARVGPAVSGMRQKQTAQRLDDRPFSASVILRSGA